MRALERIPWRRLAEPESIVLALALLNVARIGYLIQRDSRIACIVCPWYHSWGFAYEPIRLLAAAVLVRFGRPWSQAVAAALAAQVFVEGVYMGLSPSDPLAFRAGLEAWPFLTQGIVGASVLGVAWFRLARNARLGPWLRWPTRITLAILALLAAGIASNFVSYRRCEDRVATWIAREVLAGGSFTAWEGTRGWGDSASIFRRVGASPRERQADADASPSDASVGAWHTSVPFVVRVQYGVGQRTGVRAFFCFFGWTGPMENAGWLRSLDRAVMAGASWPWARFTGEGLR